MKLSIRKGFSGLIPADSQIENKYVSRQKQNTKDFWLSYHDKLHELIYAELMLNKKKKPIAEITQEDEDSSIFMPTIFEINCASKLIHDFNAEKTDNELYGISYTLISN